MIKTRSKALTQCRGPTLQKAPLHAKERDLSIKFAALKSKRGPRGAVLAFNDRRWWAEVSASGVVVRDKKNANRRIAARLWRGGAAALILRLAGRQCSLLVAAHALAEQLGRALDIPRHYGRDRALALQPEPSLLLHFGQDRYQRAIWLQASAGRALQKMLVAAQKSAVMLEVISAFRSMHYQASLLARKRRQGESMTSILSISAAPGYSEHHSGLAIDLAEAGAPALTEAFADTQSFAWLRTNAHRFGFVMSFPPDNPHQVLYEPWHWCYRPRDTDAWTRRQRDKKGSQR